MTSTAMEPDSAELSKLKADIAPQMDALVEKIEALAARVERDGVPVPPLDLSAPPDASASLAIFCEFDQLAIPLDVEAALLRSDDAPSLFRSTIEKSSLFRQEAYEALEEPLLDAIARLDATLDPDFVAFCEAASVRGAALHVISRGFKPIARHFLREAGLGHVAVLANELHVGSNNRWRVSFRDGSPSGHDKARSLKAALRLLDGERRVVYVGRTACDAAPVDGGLVHHLYAPTGSALGVHCERAGHAHRAFPGWTALARELST